MVSNKILTDKRFLIRNFHHPSWSFVLKREGCVHIVDRYCEHFPYKSLLARDICLSKLIAAKIDFFPFSTSGGSKNWINLLFAILSSVKAASVRPIPILPGRYKEILLILLRVLIDDISPQAILNTLRSSFWLLMSAWQCNWSISNYSRVICNLMPSSGGPEIAMSKGLKRA